MQEYHIIVVGLLSSDFHWARLLHYYHNAVDFVVSNQIRLQY